MKTPIHQQPLFVDKTCLRFAVAALVFAGIADARAEEDSFLNHVTFSGRAAWNVRVKFGPPPARYTPDGDAYRHLDGYVLDNDADNFNPLDPNRPITQYFGYDSYDRQISVSENTLSLTRANGDIFSHSFEDDPHLGGELSYRRELFRRSEARVGVELAANYLSLCLKDRGSVSALGTWERYELASSPLTFEELGEYTGPRSIPEDFPTPFVYRQLKDSAPAGITVFNDDKFEADLWGFRLGPFLQVPLGSKLELHVIGGLAVAVVDARWSWAQAYELNGFTSPTRKASGDETDVLWGWYVGANAAWRFSERWSAVAGAQYQDVGQFRSAAGGRRVKLDLSETVFVNFGVSYSF